MGKYMYSIVAAVIVWGATAGHYINTGMSIAMIVFALFAGNTIYKKTYPRGFHVDKNIFVALLSVYTLLLLTTLFHLDNIKNLYGGEYNWTAFVLYTMPFWMILYVGWDRDISRSIIATFSTIVLAMCVYGIYEHYAKHIDRITHLRAGQTHAVGGDHGLVHVVQQGSQTVIKGGDGAADLVQDGIALFYNVTDCHLWYLQIRCHRPSAGPPQRWPWTEVFPVRIFPVCCAQGRGSGGRCGT